MNGEAIMGSEEYFNPAALCSVQITDGSENKGEVKSDYFLELMVYSFGSVPL